MDTNVCTVCGAEFDTGTVLLDRRLKNSLTRHTCTGWGICPEHQKMIDEGYCHLVVSIATISGNTVKPEDLNRTGKIISIRKHVLEQILDIPSAPVMFVDLEAATKLESMLAKD